MSLMETILDKMGLEKKRKAAPEERELISRIYSLFEEFRSAYGAEWERQESNDRLYRGDHWEEVWTEDPNEPRPTTPIIQSTVENVKADLMDNFPEAIIQPENPQDEQVAKVVEALIKQNHDASSYNKEYKKSAHDLLVIGWTAQEVGYDPLLNNGIGGAYIRHVDAHNILFDPQCSDIQDGRAVIKVASRTVQWLEQQYPQFAGEFAGDEYTLQQDKELTYDQTKSVLLLEYWWREFDPDTQRFKVHMAKAAGRKLLEDSREQKPEGYFAHGQYPFVVTTLFPRKGSALGYGFADMLGDQQRYSDKLDQIVLKNAYMASRIKLLVSRNSGIDEADIRDWSREYIEGDQIGDTSIRWFQTSPLPQYILQYIENIRQSIKEESGANDFSRGNTASGVTAASAIAALQEASSKRSRMAARQMHEAYKDAVRLEIEVEREFNTLPREVLLTIDGEQQVATFESAMLEKQGQYGNRIPMEFFISIKVQRENRWSQMAQNELVLQMVQLQVIPPSQAVELMVFEGREAILTKMRQQPQQMNPEEAAAIEEQMQLQAAQEQMNSQMQQMPTPDMAME